MHVAQVAPLWEQLPTIDHRSVEYAISQLTDELVRRGHSVTLFAAAGSDTLAWLEPTCAESLTKARVRLQDYALYEQMQLSRVFNCPGRFDLIHLHGSLAALPYAQLSKTPVLHTIYDPPSGLEAQFCLQHRRQPLVYAGRSPWPAMLDQQLSAIATLPPAIAPERFHFYNAPQRPSYLAYLGDLSESSGIHRAIALAQRSQIPLQVAVVADAERAATRTSFFARQVAPHLDGRQIKFLGELSSSHYNRFLGQALATVCLLSELEVPTWEVAESLASGTPVLAMGAAARAIEPGLTGFVVRTSEEGLENHMVTVDQLGALSRSACRQSALAQFGIQPLVERYELLYKKLGGGRLSRLDSMRALVPVAS